MHRMNADACDPVTRDFAIGLRRAGQCETEQQCAQPFRPLHDGLPDFYIGSSSAKFGVLTTSRSHGICSRTLSAVLPINTRLTALRETAPIAMISILSCRAS